VCVRKDDISDYARRVRKGRDLRSIMKSESIESRTAVCRCGRSQIAETPSRHASRASEKERHGQASERSRYIHIYKGGEGGPLDNAVNRESSLSHRARQNTSATTVRSLRNPPTALGVDSPRRRLVDRGLSLSLSLPLSKFMGLTLVRPPDRTR